MNIRFNSLVSKTTSLLFVILTIGLNRTDSIAQAPPPMKQSIPGSTVAPGTLCYYSPTNQWLTVEQIDQKYGLNCAAPEAVAHNALEVGDFTGALEALSTVTPKCQGGILYNPLKAQAEMGVGNFKAAAELYRTSIGTMHDRMVGEYGDNSIMTQSFGDPVNWFRYAESLYRSGQTDYGVQVYNMVAASENQPTGYVGNNVAPYALPVLGDVPADIHPSVEVLTAITHIIEGLQAQEPDKEYSFFQQAVSLAPDLPITQFMMGKAEIFHSSFSVAKPYFQQAINLAHLSSDPKSAGFADAVQKYSDNSDPDVLRARWQALKDSGALDQPKQN